MTEKDLTELKKQGKIKGFQLKTGGKKIAEQADIPFEGQKQKKAGKERNAEEFLLQIKCKSHFDRYYPELKPVFFHIVNQAVVNNKEINERLAAMGRRRGIWDMKLQVPKGEFWGVWFEFKSRKGELSSDQETFRDLSIQLGCRYKWVEIRNAADFAKEVADYMEDKRFKF